MVLRRLAKKRKYSITKKKVKIKNVSTSARVISPSSSNSTRSEDADIDDVNEIAGMNNTRIGKETNSTMKGRYKDGINDEELQIYRSEKELQLSLASSDNSLTIIKQPTGSTLRSLLRKQEGLFIDEGNDDDDDDDDFIYEYRQEVQGSYRYQYEEGRENSTAKSITPVSSIPYIHSSYAAASPLLPSSRKWGLIFQHLMPLTHSALFSDQNYKNYRSYDKKYIPIQIIKRSESNPVIAAFGMLSNKSCHDDSNEETNSTYSKINNNDSGDAKLSPTNTTTSYTFPPLEWDVFLDPMFVQDLESIMIQRGSKDEGAITKMIINCLLSRMMLAHGSATQLMMEATGMAKHWNFRKVFEAGYDTSERSVTNQSLSTCGESVCGNEKADSTKDSDFVSSTLRYGNSSATDESNRNVKGGGGGMLLHQWLTLFSKSLLLGKMDEESIRMKITTEELESLTQLKTASERRPRFWYRKQKSSSESIVYPVVPERNKENTTQVDDCSSQTLQSCGLIFCIADIIQTEKAIKDNEKKSTTTTQNSLRYGSTACLVSAMCETIQQINKLLGEPLRVVLDLKSRHVGAAVWSQLIMKLQQMGLIVEAIGSFDIPEIRIISSLLPSSIKKFIFFHSAGDLQRACHAQEIERGDIVFFNAGSLLYKSGRGLKRKQKQGREENRNNRDKIQMSREDSSLSSDSYIADVNNNSVISDDYGDLVFQPFAFPNNIDQTTASIKLIDYKNYYGFQIGLYVQEYAIGHEELDALIQFINDHHYIYDLGLAWGGKNGYHLHGIEGDGMGNQRYVGRSWTPNVINVASSSIGILGSNANHCYSCGVGVGIGGDDDVLQPTVLLQQDPTRCDMDLSHEHQPIMSLSSDCNDSSIII